MPIYSFFHFTAGLWRRIPWCKVLLAAFAVMVSLVAAFVGFALWQHRQAMEAGRKTQLYRAALARLLASPKVVKALGKPIHEGEVMKVHGEMQIFFQVQGETTSAEVLAFGTGKRRPFQLAGLAVHVYKGDDIVLVDSFVDSEETPAPTRTHPRK